MERKKVLVFETTKTLMRAYELALRGSTWTLIKIQQEGRLFPAIESASPDALVVERRVLSSEMLEALGMLPLPVIFCAKEKDDLPKGRLHLPRPFSCDELFEALNAALEWNPNLIAEEPVIAEEEEEPFVLTAPDEEDSPSVIPMETQEEEEHKSFSDLPLAKEKTPAISVATESAGIPEFTPEDTKAVPETPQTTEKKPFVTEDVVPSEEKKPSETELFSSVEEPPAASVVARIAEQVEERVVEELAPSDIEMPEGAPLSEMVRTLVRRELREVMKEYFWEEAPLLMRQVLEEEIRKLAAKQ